MSIQTRAFSRPVGPQPRLIQWTAASAIAAAVAAVLAAQPAHAADAEKAATGNAGGIEEVVVTAQRREESSQKAPIPISVLSSQQLVDAGVSSAEDMTRLVPALSLYQGGQGSIQASIRGVGNLSGNTYAEQAIAFSFDGIYIARTGNVAGNFFDLDRVEVLKGPQGTLYGRNTNAGAVNIIPKRPKLGEFGGDAQVTIGNYGTLNGEAAVNLPIGSTSALRLAGQVVKHDGYLSDGYNDQDESDARVTWLLQPSSALSLLVVGTYTDRAGKGSAGVQITGSDSFDGPSSPAQQAIWSAAGFNPVTTDGYLRGHIAGVHAQLDWTTDAGTLTILPGYLDSQTYARHYAAGFPVTFDEPATSKSAEVRFASPTGGRFNYVVGGYYFNEETGFTLQADQTSFHARNLIPEISTKSLAGFGQGTLNVADALRLTLGVRYTKEDKSTAGWTTTGFDTDFSLAHGGPPPAVVPPCLYFTPSPAPTATSPGCYAALSNAISSSKSTWKAGLEYDLNPTSMLYGTVSTGFKAGGFFAAQGGVFKPETLTAFTVGSKNRFMANRLQFNIEGYYWKYKDKQVSHLGPKTDGSLDLITENAGNATMYGIEPELRFMATENDLLETTVSYEHAKYDDFKYVTVAPGPTGPGTCPTTAAGALNVPPFAPLVQVNCSSFGIPMTPEWVATAAYKHTFPLGNGARVTGAISANYRSSQVSGEEQTQSEALPSYTTFDALLGYHATGDAWSVTAFGNNLTNKVTYGSSFFTGSVPSLTAPVGPVGPTTLVNAPRTFGLRLAARF